MSKKKEKVFAIWAASPSAACIMGDSHEQSNGCVGRKRTEERVGRAESSAAKRNLSNAVLPAFRVEPPELRRLECFSGFAM